MPRCMLLPTNLYAFAHQWHGYNSESDAVCRIQVVFLGKKEALVSLNMQFR